MTEKAGITQEQFEVLMAKSCIANEFINIRAFATTIEQHIIAASKRFEKAASNLEKVIADCADVKELLSELKIVLKELSDNPKKIEKEQAKALKELVPLISKLQYEIAEINFGEDSTW